MSNEVTASLFSETKGYAKLRSEYKSLKMKTPDSDERQRITPVVQIMLERFETWTIFEHGGSILEEMILEEKQYNLKSLRNSNSQNTLSIGWFPKSISKMAEHSHLAVTKRSVRRAVNCMIESNWVVKRKGQMNKYANVNDYRLIISTVAADIEEEGVGYPMDEEVFTNVKDKL